MGTLYIVSTPIGNLGDITIRAIKTLFSVDLIACEDTRRTGFLLSRLRELGFKHSVISNGKSQSAHRPRMIAFHEHNECKLIPRIIKLLDDEKSVALVSDSGTPLISDPGYPLVRKCIKLGIPVVSIPGASSILAALVASGLPPYPMLFLGYPPKRSRQRKFFFTEVSKLMHLGGDRITVIFFASPNRVISVLEDFIDIVGDRNIVVARELTKINQEFIRNKASVVLEGFKNKRPKGELTILFGKNSGF